MEMKSPSGKNGRYLLLLNLPEDVESRVAFLKKKLEEAVGIVEKVRSRPHITLLNTSLAPRFLEIIKETVMTLTDEIKSRPLNIDGFRTFPSIKLIFLDIQEQDYLRYISRKIAEKIILAVPGFIPRPTFLEYAHVTIGMTPGISGEKFKLLGDDFLDIDFNAAFLPRSLVLFDQNDKRAVWTIDFLK